MRPSPNTSALIRAAESAYQLQGPHSTWLLGILESARPFLDRGLGMSSWLYDFRKLRSVSIVVTVGNEPDAGERLMYHMRDSNEEMVKLLYSQGKYITTASAAIGAEAARAWYSDPSIASLGLQDCLALLSTDVDGHGVGIGVALPETQELSPADGHRLECLSAHIAAAYRLRRMQGEMEAVVSPSGNIAHAEGTARAARARELLRTAAVMMDRARLRGTDADEALDLWKALVAGRWTLVDTFDSDGKRYLVARKNAPAAPPAPELSQRESQVAAFTALGHSLKTIAYELGISESSVETYLRRAMAKLAVPNRLALTRRLTEILGAPRTSESSTADGREDDLVRGSRRGE